MSHPPPAPFIKVPTDKTNGFQTMPTDPSKRLPKADLTIEPCTPSDASKIAEGLYTCFPPTWWDKKEPPSLRPPEPLRRHLLAKRLLPSLSEPHMHWVKAVHIPTGQTIGVAGWQAPSTPSIHNIFRRSAIAHYGWKDRMNWSDEEVEEMFAHVDDEAWSSQFARDDETRREVLGGERHWYLAPLITWPEWQGSGVGKRLLDWAIEQADAMEPVEPMYLESAPSARAVYLHCGFAPVGEVNFLRRGPRDVRGLEAEGEVGGSGC